jgi:orotate phosphoribosyltransferase
MNDGAFDLRSALVARGALLEGHFHLSSGRHSDRYVQKFRILEDPAMLESLRRRQRSSRRHSSRLRSCAPLGH